MRPIISSRTNRRSIGITMAVLTSMISEIFFAVAGFLSSDRQQIIKLRISVGETLSDSLLLSKRTIRPRVDGFFSPKSRVDKIDGETTLRDAISFSLYMHVQVCSFCW